MAYGFNEDKSKATIRTEDINFTSGTMSFDANETKEYTIALPADKSNVIGVLGFEDGVDSSNHTKFCILSYYVYSNRIEVRIKNMTNSSQSCWFSMKYAYI